jgi:hypothetical protein
MIQFATYNKMSKTDAGVIASEAKQSRGIGSVLATTRLLRFARNDIT